MADLKKKFEAAQADVQKLTKRPDDEDMLRLYAQYKQATAGDVTGDRPGAFELRRPRQVRRVGEAQGHGLRRRRWKPTSSWSSA